MLSKGLFRNRTKTKTMAIHPFIESSSIWMNFCWVIMRMASIRLVITMIRYLVAIPRWSMSVMKWASSRGGLIRMIVD